MTSSDMYMYNNATCPLQNEKTSQPTNRSICFSPTNPGVQ